MIFDIKQSLADLKRVKYSFDNGNDPTCSLNDMFENMELDHDNEQKLRELILKNQGFISESYWRKIMECLYLRYQLNNF